MGKTADRRLDSRLSRCPWRYLGQYKIHLNVTCNLRWCKLHERCRHFPLTWCEFDHDSFKFPRSKNIYMSISAAVYTGTELSKQGANHPSAIVTSGYILWPQPPGGGGALGYFLGGYVPPGTPNWHPVLKKIPLKLIPRSGNGPIFYTPF